MLFQGADLFIGVSVGGIVTEDMVAFDGKRLNCNGYGKPYP